MSGDVSDVFWIDLHTIRPSGDLALQVISSLEGWTSFSFQMGILLRWSPNLVQAVSSANPATLEGYGLYRLPDGLIAPIAFKIGEESVHKYRNTCQIGGSTKFQYFAIFGAYFGQNPECWCRKILFFGDFFVSTATIFPLGEFKTGRKQHEPNERNLKFPKLFSDPKNINFEEN